MTMHIGKSFSVAGLVVFGTVNSLFAKIVYELKDYNGHAFTKPWAMTLVMFLGMLCCLPLAWYEDYREQQRIRAKRRDASSPLLRADDDNNNDNEPHPSTARQLAMLLIPTAFDLTATALMNVGLLYVTASVYQMMRGAEIVFSAIFAVTFLRRHLNRSHYGGMLLCAIGIGLVGLASQLEQGGTGSEAGGSNKVVMGMLLIIASQAVQAAQVTFEDYFMTDFHIAPLKIVAYEGLYGTIFMLCVVLPIAQKLPGPDGIGMHEDSIASWKSIRHTPAIAWTIVVSMAATAAYNVAGMSVTENLGAVHRTVLETMRTLCVWLVDLILYYTIHTIGERWDMQYSWIQLVGFIILFIGTLVYGHGDEHAAKQDAHDIHKSIATRRDEEAPAAAAAPVPPAVARAVAQFAARGRVRRRRGAPMLKSTRSMLSGGYRSSLDRWVLAVERIRASQQHLTLHH